MSHQSPSLPGTVWQPSDNLKALKWPEEDLTSTVDDGGGFYPMRLGDTLDDTRFVITRKLGWGGFSTVWLARDREDDRHVAIKVLSAYASREVEEGRLGERELLQKVTNASPSHHGFKHVIHLLHEFTFESFAGKHICFVTDVLSCSVPSLQRQLGGLQLPLKFILRLTKDVLKGLQYLHDECKVIHSDLKPGNILLLPSDVDNVVTRELIEKPSMVYDFLRTVTPDQLPFYPIRSAPLIFELDTDQDSKLHWVITDLGHAHPQGERLSNIVQPYALRAPEVILGLEWGPAIDIWSLGCLMYEFATGHWLFNPQAMGGIPRSVVHLAQMTQRTGQDHDDAALKQYEIQKKHNDLKDMLKRATLGDTDLMSIESELNGLNGPMFDSDGPEEVATFARIMRSFLALDPAERPCAAEALLDPAFEDL